MRTAPRHRQLVQRGLSLVELMVGVAIGLFITAAAAMLVSTQLSGNRQLLVETQIQQDLRATAELVTRDLRRASYVQTAYGFASLLDSPDAPLTNWAGDILITPGVAGSSQVDYQYNRGLDPGFSLRLSAGVLQRRLGTGSWQPVTDANVLTVTRFNVAQNGSEVPAVCPIPLRVSCPTLCADGTESCWPCARVRELAITIEGESATGTKVQRRIQSTVRVRNDYVSFNTDTPAQVCP